MQTWHAITIGQNGIIIETPSSAAPAAGHGPVANSSGNLVWSDSPLATQAYVSSAVSAISLTWDSISGKPATFPPSSHTHATSEVTGLDAALAAKLGVSAAASTYLALSGGTLTGALNGTAATFSGVLQCSYIRIGGDSGGIIESYYNGSWLQTYGAFDAQSFWVGGSSGDAKISRGVTGPTVDVCANGGLRSRNNANNADAPITASRFVTGPYPSDYLSLAASDGSSWTMYAGSGFVRMHGSTKLIWSGSGTYANQPVLTILGQLSLATPGLGVFAADGTTPAAFTAGAATVASVNLTGDVVALDVNSSGVSNFGQITHRGNFIVGGNVSSTSVRPVLSFYQGGATYGQVDVTSGGVFRFKTGAGSTVATIASSVIDIPQQSSNWSAYSFSSGGVGRGSLLFDPSRLIIGLMNNSYATNDIGFWYASDGSINLRDAATYNSAAVFSVSKTGAAVFNGGAVFGGAVKLGTFTAATLPSASANSGASAIVTNSSAAFTSANVGATVGGGGSNVVPVFSNGTNWVIG